MKKITPKTAKARAWKALSEYVRAKDKKCVTCPTGNADHCGHYLRNSERNQQLGGNALWYDIRNFGGQDVRCNNFGGGEQAKFALYLEEKHGHGILQELEKLRQTYKLWTLAEILEVEEKYKKLLAELD